MCLSINVKVMNDTADQNGLVPSLLLFGEMRNIPYSHQGLLYPSERHKAMDIARNQFEGEIAKRRVQTALVHKLPISHKFRFAPRQPVHGYMEKEKSWTGPHLVRSADEKSVFVDLGEVTGARKFNMSRVKPAKLPSIQSLIPPSTPHTHGTGVQAPMLHTQHNNPMTFFTEIIENRDPSTGMFEEAKKKGVQGLIDHGTFRLVMRADAGDSPNIISSRFVLSIKHKKSEPHIYKARFFCCWWPQGP